MTATLIFRTNDPAAAKRLNQELAARIHHLKEDGDASTKEVTVSVGQASIHRGALETVVEFVSTIDFGGLSVAVASGLLANWIWSLIKKDPSKPEAPPAEIKIMLDHGGSHLELEAKSKVDLKISLKRGLRDG
jgi:hypothetical protein